MTPEQIMLAKRTAAHMKRTGMMPGVADLAFVIRGNPYFLELKTEKGAQSDAQKAFQRSVEAAGGTYAIAYGLTQALSILRAWGAIKQDRRAA